MADNPPCVMLSFFAVLPRTGLSRGPGEMVDRAMSGLGAPERGDGAPHTETELQIRFWPMALHPSS